MPIYLLSAFLPRTEMLLCWLAGYPKVKFSDGIFRFRPNAGVECQRGGRGRIEFSGPTTHSASSMVDRGPLRKIWDGSGTDVIPSVAFCEERHEMIT